LCLCTLNIKAQNIDGIPNYIAPGVYQLTYPNQFIYFNFKQSLIPGGKDFFTPAELSEKEQIFVVNTLKEQIDILPSDFIEEYLNVNIYPFHIFDKTTFGYHYEDQIVVEVDKILPAKSYKQSIKLSFVRQLAYLVEERLNSSEGTQALKEYLKEIYEEHWFDHEENNNGLYANGFVSEVAASAVPNNYSPTDEYAEIFSHLICLDSREEIINFIEANPKSILTEKIIRFVSYLEGNIPSLNHAYFFGEQMDSNLEPNVESALNGAQLLASHELKSNELYDFSFTSLEDEYEFSTASNSENYEFIEGSDQIDNRIITTAEADIVHTFFNTDATKKSEKKKKTKKKKDGTGLLIIGGLIYLTLELLSQ